MKDLTSVDVIQQLFVADVLDANGNVFTAEALENMKISNKNINFRHEKVGEITACTYKDKGLNVEAKLFIEGDEEEKLQKQFGFDCLMSMITENLVKFVYKDDMVSLEMIPSVAKNDKKSNT